MLSNTNDSRSINEQKKELIEKLEGYLKENKDKKGNEASSYLKGEFLGLNYLPTLCEAIPGFIRALAQPEEFEKEDFFDHIKDSIFNIFNFDK